MKYANTKMIDGVETVAVVLPLAIVPAFDPSNPPQENTYGVADDVQVGWVKQGGSFVAPIPTLSESKAAKAAALNAACQGQIFAGYVSSALGSLHTYPAKQIDQSNMVASVTSSLYPGLSQDWQTPFWCADSNGVWAYRMHTASQIQQAGADGKTAILVALSKNAVLQAQVAAATTLAQVDAVVW